MYTRLDPTTCFQASNHLWVQIVKKSAMQSFDPYLSLENFPSVPTASHYLVQFFFFGFQFNSQLQISSPKWLQIKSYQEFLLVVDQSGITLLYNGIWPISENTSRSSVFFPCSFYHLYLPYTPKHMSSEFLVFSTVILKTHSLHSTISQNFEEIGTIVNTLKFNIDIMSIF